MLLVLVAKLKDTWINNCHYEIIWENVVSKVRSIGYEGSSDDVTGEAIKKCKNPSWKNTTSFRETVCLELILLSCVNTSSSSWKHSCSQCSLDDFCTVTKLADGKEEDSFFRLNDWLLLCLKTLAVLNQQKNNQIGRFGWWWWWRTRRGISFV